MKVDLYNHKNRYENWKALAVNKNYIESDLTKKNSKLLIEYVFDMEQGHNKS